MKLPLGTPVRAGHATNSLNSCVAIASMNREVGIPFPWLRLPPSARGRVQGPSGHRPLPKVNLNSQIGRR